MNDIEFPPNCYLYNYDGQTHMATTPLRVPPDETLFNWFRGVPCSPYVSVHDIIFASDVRYLQPFLYFLCRTIHAKVAVEIGVADGSTTLPILKAVSEVDGGRLYSVDPHVTVQPSEENIGAAASMVQRNGLLNWWTLFQGTSNAFFDGGRAPQQIDFAFIDGDHCCGPVMRDARNILSRLTPGGICIFHEWGDAPSYEEIRSLPLEAVDGDAGSYGTQRALAAVLPEYAGMIDIMPLDFGGCGIDRFHEWTEGGAVMIRKRRQGEFRIPGRT